MQAAYTLLTFGASVTRPDERGYSPLLHAVKSHNADMVNHLLRIGLHDRSVCQTPLVCAVREVRSFLHLHLTSHTHLATATFS